MNSIDDTGDIYPKECVRRWPFVSVYYKPIQMVNDAYRLEKIRNQKWIKVDSFLINASLNFEMLYRDLDELWKSLASLPTEDEEQFKVNWQEVRDECYNFSILEHDHQFSMLSFLVNNPGIPTKVLLAFLKLEIPSLYCLIREYIDQRKIGGDNNIDRFINYALRHVVDQLDQISNDWKILHISTSRKIALEVYNVFAPLVGLKKKKRMDDMYGCEFDD